MIRIGVQGDAGSFSEEAGITFAKQQQYTHYEIIHLTSSENVLTSVELKKIEQGVIAIENSKGGVVFESIHALASHRCHVITLFHILVKQNLLVLPGITPDQIHSIHSHPQALKQCRGYLKKHFTHCHQIEEEDTAQAAQRLSTHALPQTAGVIANEACAELYHLEILEKNIQDMQNNLTLFMAVGPFKG